MKKFITLLCLTCLFSSSSFAQVKIGLPAGAPQASSVLDLSNTGDGTKGFSLPRVASTASIVTPVNGMFIYDLSSNCTKVYDNGVWSVCISSPAGALGAAVNCKASDINGNYNQGTALTAANTITIIVNNNTASALTITPAISDVDLSGTAAAGMSVASVSPASVSPGAGGGASTITYTLSGTPTTAGSFTAIWTKLGLTCAKTGNVCLTMGPIVVSSTTTPATLPIPTAAGNTINFVAAGGTPNTSITWAIVTDPATGIISSPATGTGATAQAILVAHASGLVTITFSAVNACGLTVTGTQGVAVSDLAVNSTLSAINDFYSKNTALTAANTVTIVLVNNSNVNETVTPLTTDLVLSGAGAAGITVASFAPASVPVAANGGTSTITYILSGTPTTVGDFTATWYKFGLSTAKSSAVCLNISPITVTNTPNPFPLPKPVVAGNTVSFSATGGTPNSTAMSWTLTSIPATGVFTSPASGTGNTAQAVLVDGAIGYVTATFTVTNTCGLLVTGTSTAALEDNLRKALVAGGCISCAAYDAAAANTWVQITAAEYTQIDNFMPVTIAACPEQYMTTVGNGWGGDYTGIGFATTAAPITLPINNYVVAFSSFTAPAQTGTNVSSFLKYSASLTSGYNTTGPTLKIGTMAAGTRFYNIMKAPSAVISTTGATYVGFFGGSPMVLLTVNVSPPGYQSYDGSGNLGTVATLRPQLFQYQVKGTASRVW